MQADLILTSRVLWKFPPIMQLIGKPNTKKEKLFMEKLVMQLSINHQTISFSKSDKILTP